MISLNLFITAKTAASVSLLELKVVGQPVDRRMVDRKKTVDEHGRDEGMNYLLSMIGFQCVCHLVLHRMMYRLGEENIATGIVFPLF